MTYYNEFDPRMAAWLRELIARKLIPDGVVDERSITEINASDLEGFTQCHFFAGIGGWSLALQLAGWPEDRPVWTGSCPCQPFSVAGKGKGTADERHLWPVFAKLIGECRPPTVFGEQVASKDGRQWLAGVFADLEAMAYRRAGADLCAAGIAAPHIRQRLYWLADTEQPRRETTWVRHEIDSRWQPEPGRASRGLEHPEHPEQPGLEGHAGNGDHGDQPGRVGAHPSGPVAPAGAVGGVGDTEGRGLGVVGDEAWPGSGGHADGSSNPPNDAQWSESYWHLCRDGKHRRVPVEPALFPLADGGIYMVPGVARRRTVRPALLHGAGNAIVPQTAAEFVQAYLETLTP